METKQASVLQQLKLNPCYLESLRSLECQETKQLQFLPKSIVEKASEGKSAEKFDPKAECAREIKEYQRCREFWDKIYSFRRRHHIRPYTPGLEEQRIIRQTYKTTKSIEKVYGVILEGNKSSTQQQQQQ